MSKPRFPITVKRGHTVVKIYATPSRGCDLYTVTYYLGTKRQRKSFSDLNLAYTEAETLATKLSQGELNVLELKNEDRLSYVRAMEALRPSGVPLEMAAIHFAEAHRVLAGSSLVDAARFYAKHHPSNLPRKSVPEVVSELIIAKEGDGLADVYIKDLRGRLGRFQKGFPGKISEISIADIEDFLRKLKANDKNGEATVPLSATSRNNYRRAIGTLFYFAESRGYVPKGVVDIESVAVAKERPTEIEVFRPEEMSRLLGAADASLIPFLAIGAFAGLRHAELQRLDWSEIRLEAGHIEVKALKAKTASRRLVPITENLRKWLQPHSRPQGPVCPYANMTKQLMWLAESVDQAWRKEKVPGSFVWKHNALRHSFVSYRVADVKNVAQVALEAGNSPGVLLSNYRELVTPADAKLWFSIEPTPQEAPATSGDPEPTATTAVSA